MSSPASVTQYGPYIDLQNYDGDSNTAPATSGSIYLTGSDASERVRTLVGILTPAINLNSSTEVTSVLDQDNMSSDSATALATQQSIKAYVDSKVGDSDLDFQGDSGTGAVDLDSQTFDIAGGTGLTTVAGSQTLTVNVNGVLEDLNTLGAASVDGEFIVATGAGAFAYESGATARTSMGVGTGDSPQFTGLTLTGDLTVQGTTTTLDTSTVQVQDPIMQLNYSDGSAAAGANSGIQVGRDGSTDALLQWNETTDLWEVGIVGTLVPLVGTTSTQTLTNKTLTSPVLTTPQINDASSDHQYVFAGSELTADRTVTLPLLTGADEFTFNAHTQTLTNKTLTAPAINGVVGGTATSQTITALTTAGITATADIDIGAYDLRASTFTADSLTSGRVPFASTNGLLIDDSDFTFATDTLTVTKLGAYEQAGAVNFSDEAMTNVNIDSGAIDGTAIGAASQSTLKATTISGSGACTLASTLVVQGATTSGGVLKTDDTTEATSTTDGSLQTDGGLSVVKSAVIGDDLDLLSDGAILNFGADKDVSFTHVADTGLLLNGAMAITFRDSGVGINSGADGALDLTSDGSIDMNVGAAGVIVKGTTPKLTIGDAGAEDTFLVFDGNAQDYRIGLDDGTDKLEIGVGAAHGTTTAMTIDSSQQVAITATTAASSTTSGALTVAGGASVAADLYVGDDLELDSDGAKLGFGADSDVSLTHVADTGLLLNSTMAIQFNDSSQYIKASSAADLDLAATTDINMDCTTVDINGALDVSGATQLSGRVTVGASTSGLDVIFYGTNANDQVLWDASENALIIKDGGTETVRMGGDATTDYAIDVGNGSAGTNNINKIRASAFVTFSDERLKSEVSPMRNALKTVNSLKAVDFTWKEDGQRDFGFLAQDMKDVIPGAVHGTEEGMFGVDYGRLTAVLVSAIQEQSAQIKALQAKINKK